MVLRLLFVYVAIACLSGATAQPHPATDTDGDGVADARDNCLSVANPDQRDTNADGFGNLCDMDLNDDGSVNFGDLQLVKFVYLTDDPDADANGDGIVNAIDLSILRELFFKPPGPTRFVSWAAEESGAWNDPQNWRPARVPLGNDHVLIGGPAGTVSLSAAGMTSVASLAIGGSLDIAAPASLVVEFGVELAPQSTLALNGASLSAGTIDLEGTLSLEDVDLSLPPIASPTGGGVVRFLAGAASTLADARFTDTQIVVESLSKAVFSGLLYLNDSAISVETNLPVQRGGAQTTELDWRALTSLEISGIASIEIQDGDAPAATTQLRLVPDSGLLQLPPDIELVLFGAATLSANTMTPTPTDLSLPIRVEFDGELLIEANGLRLGGFVECRFGKLTFAAEVTAAEIGPGTTVLLNDCAIQTPDGLVQNGTMQIVGSNGTLGGLTGEGTTEIFNSQLRLVGLHRPGYLTEDNSNHFELAGSVGRMPGFFDMELTVRADDWSFEPGSRLFDLDVTAMNALVGAGQAVILQDVLLSGDLSVAPGAEVGIDGDLLLIAATLRLQAPDTVQSAPPVLRFTGIDGSLSGFGTILVEAAVTPGIDLTEIVIDTTGAPFLIEDQTSIESWRSARLRIESTAGLLIEGLITVDGANALSGETVQFETAGVFENQGTIRALNGARHRLSGDWINATGLIDAQGASLELAGNWENSGQINVTESSIALTLHPSVGSVGSIALTDATMLLGGVYSPDALNDVSAAGDSQIRFDGIIDSSTGLIDLDALPAGFVLTSGGLLQNIDVTGAVPLVAEGGTLDNVGLLTDVIVVNGATLTILYATLFETAIELSADDALTTLRVTDGGDVGGSGEVRFAGTTMSDALNVIEVSPGGSLFDDVVLRTTTSGGRIVSVPAESTTLFSEISLEAPGRELFLDAPGEAVTMARDLSLGAGTILSSNSDALILGSPIFGPITLSVDVAGLDDFGRIVTISPSLPGFDANQSGLIVNMVNGFVPSECDSFLLVNGYFPAASFGPVSGTGLAGLNIDLAYEPFDTVVLTLFQSQPCP